MLRYNEETSKEAGVIHYGRAVPMQTESWETPYVGNTEELSLLFAKGFVKYSITPNHVSIV